MSSLEVRAPSGAYEVRIGAGLLADPDSWTGWPSASSAVVVTNATVAGHWSEALMRGLRTAFGKITQVELPDGEDHKDWPTLNRIFDHLLAHKCDRQTLLIALGGGVVGDITGFAAGCYMRGIAYVQVPTTLLAQVDSSVGGKTAINHPLGKNMIGLFHQPQRVICDLDTLGTLPQREFVAGLAEVIKYGPIADEAFLRWLEANLDALLSRDAAALAHAVRRSCEIKAQVVGADERESGLRAILNFGHTFGHAIEAGLGYGQWLHGEAVGCGMRMATDLSVRLELVPPETLERMQTLLDRAGLPRSAPDWSADRWWSLMGHDKKAQAGSVRFVLLDRIGHALMRTAPRALVDDVVAAAARGWR